MTGAEEYGIIRRVQDGDREAYRLLVDRYKDMVFHVALQFAPDLETAQDLAQEAFVRAYEGIGRFRFQSSFATWLYRIALNLGRDYLRRRRLRATESLEVALEVASERADPDRELERAEFRRALQRALARLPEAYAIPFLMRYSEELSYEEMAARLAVAPEVLKVRVFRARQKLQRMLRRWT
ncbi:MAG: sigma-70 family RNA polymerase sigma factor [Bacteroidetes bacterium]|nr:sigma-70 family RNA polymerase sigma factor [Rhodothermia bacterium]MCS7155313.1 sigma-70 family RNA polymerase sigma factor [Bacteroidota bacterium]MCX7907594.1 sigma-70 family RNA polymerase sigma factor [Bacteroidota bacterium]MDW8138588.1 sigma-70 family RNA polymerase sigma factor [Bacteroidota bacterium]MDW8284475.1 sigma-70 family RNA polymerase sigma factor [Bacteroidota bacterium]